MHRLKVVHITTFLRNFTSRNWRDIVVVLLLFLLTFIVRAYQLGQTPIYPDEITWMVRSKESALAIRTQRFDYFKTAWWNIKDDTEAIAIPLTFSVGFPIIYLAKDASVLSFNLFQDYIVGRYVVIFITSIFMSIFYLFLRKVLDKKMSLLASFLLTMDPTFLANSKIIMNDIYLTIFLFISLASYLLIKNKLNSVILSAVGLSLAFLTKPNGLILIPIFALQIFLNKDRLVEIKKFVLTLFFAFVVVLVLWPNSWANPFFAIPEYLLRQTSLVQNGINNYFFGQITNNPPFYYYIFEILVKIPPIIILSFISLLLFFFSKAYRKQSGSKFLISLFTFLVLFLITVSFSAKKLGARYVLPIWPWIYLLSMYPLHYLMEKFRSKLLKISFLTLLVISTIYNYFHFFPYHDLYYNFLIGGSENAAKYDLVGLCSGSKASVDYISKCYLETNTIGALGCGRSTIPYYYPNSFDYNWKKDGVWFVEAYYVQLNKDPEVTNFYEKNKPTHTISINGLNLAYIYAREGIKNNCK